MSIISRPERMVFNRKRSTLKNSLKDNQSLLNADEYDMKLTKFKSGFSEPQLKKCSTLKLANNINLIYMTLIALTKLFRE